jgi:hypothetical protein
VATRWIEEANGTFGEFIVDGGTAFRRLFNPNDTKVKGLNVERQRATQRRMDWGQMVADIPEADLPVLRLKFGEALLNPSHPKEDRRRALTQFMCSTDSDPYRVVNRWRR